MWFLSDKAEYQLEALVRYAEMNIWSWTTGDDCHGALGSDNNDVVIVHGGVCESDVDADNHGDFDAGINLIELY